MHITKRHWRYIVYIIEIILFFAIQEIPIQKFFEFDLRPLLLIPICVSIAFFESDIVGMSFGIFAGFLIDLGMNGNIGISTILLAIICFFISFLSTNSLHTNLLTVFIASFIVCVLIYMFYFLIFYLSKGYEDINYAFYYYYLSRMSVTIILTPIFYWFNKAIALNIVEEE